uniref:Putative 12-oxophytodienoate reductase n=1 Tax=Ralstonia solanacearum TaxID=305 RepID=A0A0S4TMR0_RALSL|nr:putative 12-oxophytodienoate reductase [Ralstonia solanacearum]
MHAKGGHLFIQRMHAGRMSHPDNTPHHRPGVAPSAIAPGTPMFTATGMQDIPAPRALTTEEVRRTVDDFRLAARRAIEVATAIADEIGADRTGIRLSPGTTMRGIDEGAEGPDLYRYLVAELDKLGLAYLHVMHQGDEPLLADLRNRWKQPLIVNRPGRPRGQVGADVASGLADLEADGQMVLANPDFVGRLKADAPMNEAQRHTFFGGSAPGDTDYPTPGRRRRRLRHTITPAIATLQRANHGSHFRAYLLRGAAALIDPFIGVDHARMSAPTFPPHPHAGFSAVSYLFLDSETGIDNRDSIGTHNLTRPGGLHWTTAGRGIVHEEVPAETGKTVHSLQSFVNLPPQRRATAPS